MDFVETEGDNIDAAIENALKALGVAGSVRRQPGSERERAAGLQQPPPCARSAEAVRAHRSVARYATTSSISFAVRIGLPR